MPDGQGANGVEAVIFDLDDTLVASSTSWVRAETRLYELLGRGYDPEIASTYKGMTATAVGRTMWQHIQPASHSMEECGQLLRQYLIAAAKAEAPRLMPGAPELVERLHGNYPLAIASGSPVEVIASVVERCAWGDCFQVLVSSEDVANGKPAPDVFLETARRLELEPQRCLVIEDSAHGVESAKRAGMLCFAVNQRERWAELQLADQIFGRLDEIELPVRV